MDLLCVSCLARQDHSQCVPYDLEMNLNFPTNNSVQMVEASDI